MKYVLIAKTNKYGKLYYKKESHEIYQMKERRNSRRSMSDGSNITPPLFFAVLTINVIYPWILKLLSNVGASYPFVLFSVVFVLFLAGICYFENKKLNRVMVRANKVDIQRLEHSEKKSLLRELEIATMTLYLNVNRFLGVLLFLVVLPICIGVFYKFPSNLRLIYISINELAVYIYIVAFTSQRRREMIFRQIKDSVEI